MARSEIWEMRNRTAIIVSLVFGKFRIKVAK
jgi:hypothetical protein